MIDRASPASTLPHTRLLLVLSAPSGAGKTTLSQKLIKRLPGVSLSISHTTRDRRAGEVPGTDYHFVNQDQFASLKETGGFAECAKVHGAWYGTTASTICDTLAGGRDLLLDIDVQGAAQLKRNYPSAVLIFILPPSWDELRKRLRDRGTEGEDRISVRMARAKEETNEIHRYDYCIINDDVDRSLNELVAIVTAERRRVSRLNETLVQPADETTR